MTGRERRQLRGFLLLALHGAQCCTVPSLAEPATALPAAWPATAPAVALDAGADTTTAPADLPYDAWTGTESTAGDYFVRVEEWRHPATGTTVTLLPMVHVADPCFYATVEQRLQGADVVLTEGVGGSPSLSPTTFLLAYVFGNYSRACWLGELSLQSGALDEGPRAQRGDLDQAEFSASMGCGASLLQGVALPILALLVEPLHFGRWLLANGRGATGDGVADAAAFRHWLVSDFADTTGADPDDDGLLPGVIEQRNDHLLGRLDAVLAQPDVRSVALPWGASHMHGIAAGLHERGFQRAGSEWLRAIAVRGLLDGSAPDPDAARSHFYLPYLVDWRSDRVSNTVGVLCDAVTVETAVADAPFTLDLLWGLLLHWQSGRERGESSFGLLPQLFARPLLLEWRRRGDAHRVRFLWFFEVGE